MRPKSFVLDYSHPLAKGLVFAGLGAMAGGTHYHDSSAYGCHGALQGMRPGNDWTVSSGRRALIFEASRGELISGIGNLELTGKYEYTVAVRAKIEETYGSTATLFAYDDTADYLWAFWDADDVRSRLDHGASSTVLNGPDKSSFDYDREFHYAVTYRSGVAYSVYFNGTLHDSAVISGAVNVPATQQFIIAGRNGGSYCWEGIVSDVIVYHRCLPANQVAELADPSNVTLSGMIRDVGDIGNVYDIENIR